MTAIVVAKSTNNVIGTNNELPWYLPEDLKHFKQLTQGHSVVMGRKTYESIVARIHKPLPDRRNIVISSSLRTIENGFELVHSLEEAIQKAGDTIFIIGGGTIYEESLRKNIVDTIFLTEVHADIEGDVYFPLLDVSQWQESARETHQSDEFHAHAFDFITLRKL